MKQPAADTAVEYHKSTVREYFESICVAVILALFVRTFIVQAFKIPTGSMENNLLIGDHLLVNKFVFGPTISRLERMLLPIDEIKRGDVIVFKFPEDPERDFIKRTIGLPGDTIELRNKKVYVNGKPLDEPYVHFLFPPPGDTPEEDFDVRVHYGPVTVPPEAVGAKAAKVHCEKEVTALFSSQPSVVPTTFLAVGTTALQFGPLRKLKFTSGVSLLPFNSLSR